MPKAILTGVTGMDGSNLSEFLLDKGYEVVGVVRRSSYPYYPNVEHLLDNPRFILEDGDLIDFGSISRIVQKHQPDEFYNLGAMSFVAASWDQPIATEMINFNGVGHCLEAIRLFSPKTKFLQASSSEKYGDVTESPQNENTPARPRSPYAAAKYGAELLVKVYRESYNLFACCSICFNHEGTRRSVEFVTRKITDWIGRSWNLVDQNIDKLTKGSGFLSTQEAFDLAFDKGIIKPLELGNLDAFRDWSDSRDMVRGMWLMLQQYKPDEYVLSSGQTRSIRQFLDTAFNVIGISDWSKLVVINPKFFRPAEVGLLLGDSTKAREKMGWYPEISFSQMVEEMVKHDIEINDGNKRF